MQRKQREKVRIERGDYVLIFRFQQFCESISKALSIYTAFAQIYLIAQNKLQNLHYKNTCMYLIKMKHF